MLIFTQKKRQSALCRTILAALLLIGTGFQAIASGEDLLVVIFNNGERQSYVLADRPKVTFDANTLYVKSADVTDSHALADVKKFVFENELSAITTPDSDERRLTFTDGSNIIIEGHAAGCTVTVTDINGRTMTTLTTGPDGKAHINISDLVPGVYVIATTDGKSYKILKR